MDDVDLLTRVAIWASCDPCQLSRADTLELLARAGLAGTHVHDVIAAKPDGPVLMRRDGVQEALRLARLAEQGNNQIDKPRRRSVRQAGAA